MQLLLGSGQGPWVFVGFRGVRFCPWAPGGLSYPPCPIFRVFAPLAVFVSTETSLYWTSLHVCPAHLKLVMHPQSNIIIAIIIIIIIIVFFICGGW